MEEEKGEDEASLDFVAEGDAKGGDKPRHYEWGAPLGTDARRSLLQIRSSTSTRSSCARNRLKAISPRRLAHSRKGARRTNEAFAAETKEERVWTTQLRKLDRPRERRRGYSYMRKGRRPDEEKEGIEGCEGARRGGSARSRGKSTTRTDVRDMGRSRASPSRRAGPEGRGGNAAVRQGAVDAPAGARGPCERGQQFVLDGASTNEKKRARTCRRPCSPLPSLPHRPRPRRRARGGSCAGPPARPGRPPSSAPRGSWAGTPVGVDLHQPDARTASRDEQKGRRRTSSWWTNSVRGATQNRLAWTKANASSWLSPVLIMT